MDAVGIGVEEEQDAIEGEVLEVVGVGEREAESLE